ncbi:uncharacterized protein LOC143298921 [Babylonia areolata]|uniref:uncharacterized protein LOC143298921 n=1 Tax=Babylonia areolata TaxID=304850 RepID=UPI003FD6308E
MSSVHVVCVTLAVFSLLAVARADGLLENVAVHKECGMSTSYNPSIENLCSRAVNGDRGGIFLGTENCIHTKIDDPQPWFEVDLGRPYPIMYLVVMARETLERRMANCKITVDGQDCFQFPKDTSSWGREMRVNCTRPLSGRVIRITKVIDDGNPGWDTPLNFCELEVYSCVKEAWGSGCDEQCGDCLDGEPCDKVNGHCMQCQPGLLPPFCHQPVVNQEDVPMTNSGCRATTAYFVSGALAAVLSVAALP